MEENEPPWAGEGSERQRFCERAVQHRMNGVRAGLSAAGYTEFEIVRAMLRYSVQSMQDIARDPDVIDDAIDDARRLAEQIDDPENEELAN